MIVLKFQESHNDVWMKVKAYCLFFYQMSIRKLNELQIDYQMPHYTMSFFFNVSRSTSLRSQESFIGDVFCTILPLSLSFGRIDKNEMGSITFTWKMCVCESESPQIQVTVISFINGKMINAQPVCDQGIAKNEMVENNICVENIVHWQPSKPDVSRPPNFSDLSLLSYFLSIIIQFMAETAAIYEIRESFPWKGLTLKESPTLSKMFTKSSQSFW